MRLLSFKKSVSFDPTSAGQPEVVTDRVADASTCRGYDNRLQGRVSDDDSSREHPPTTEILEPNNVNRLSDQQRQTDSNNVIISSDTYGESSLDYLGDGKPMVFQRSDSIGASTIGSTYGSFRSALSGSSFKSFNTYRSSGAFASLRSTSFRSCVSSTTRQPWRSGVKSGTENQGYQSQGQDHLRSESEQLDSFHSCGGADSAPPMSWDVNAAEERIPNGHQPGCLSPASAAYSGAAGSVQLYLDGSPGSGHKIDANKYGWPCERVFNYIFCCRKQQKP